MKQQYIFSFLFLAIIYLGGSAFSSNQITALNTANDKQKSLEAFEIILSVLTHPRCINCHPSADRPRQGDDQHIHKLNVVRGEDNHGGPVQKCATCHQEENNPYTNVPGAPHWGLAPKSMGWYGLSNIEIGLALVDETKNGGRSRSDIAQHMTEDALVLWAWNPGEGREKPPVSLEKWKATVKEWIDSGAYVPQSD